MSGAPMPMIPKLSRDLTANHINKLRKTGKKGIFAVMLGIAFWASTSENSLESNKAFKTALTDLEWVLSSFNDVELKGKRKPENIPEGERAVKRCLFLFCFLTIAD